MHYNGRGAKGQAGQEAGEFGDETMRVRPMTPRMMLGLGSSYPCHCLDQDSIKERRLRDWLIVDWSIDRNFSKGLPPPPLTAH
jgi:hypothetical protein